MNEMLLLAAHVCGIVFFVCLSLVLAFATFFSIKTLAQLCEEENKK